MSKPSEFYVGVLDVFAILLPGAIASAVLAPRVGASVFGILMPPPTEDAAAWAAFLVSSYFLGHLVFLIGSYIDPLYNLIRQRRSPYGNESAYQCATTIRNHVIEVNEQKPLNTFQWSRAVLIACCPAAAEDVHRLEADSKFFRSLLVICVLVAVVYFVDARVFEALFTIGLIPVCFARYYERRLKSTTQAYIHIVAQYRLGKLTTPNRVDAVQLTNAADEQAHR